MPNLLRGEGNRLQREMLMQLHVDFVVGVAPRYVGPPFPDGMGCVRLLFSKMWIHGSGMYAECVHSPLAGSNSVRGDRVSLYLARSGLVGITRESPAQIKGWRHIQSRVVTARAVSEIQRTAWTGTRLVWIWLSNPELVQYCPG